MQGTFSGAFYDDFLIQGKHTVFGEKIIFWTYIISSGYKSKQILGEVDLVFLLEKDVSQFNPLLCNKEVTVNVLKYIEK